MHTKSTHIPFGRDQFTHEFGQPLVHAMDDIASFTRVVQHLQSMVSTFTNSVDLDRKAATKQARRVIRAASGAMRALQDLTLRKVTASALENARKQHLPHLRTALAAAEILAADERAAVGQRVIEIGVAGVLREQVLRWEAAVGATPRRPRRRA